MLHNKALQRTRKDRAAELKHWVTEMKLIRLLVPLLLLTSSCRSTTPQGQLKPRLSTPSTKNIVVLGRCSNIVPTGKRHETFIFTVDVTSVREGKFEHSQAVFELYHDFGGRDLLTALSAKRTSNRGKPVTFAFDKTKVIVLTVKPNAEPYPYMKKRFGVNTKVRDWRIEAVEK